MQSAYDRASKLGDDIYVVTEASHSDHVKEQLPELDDDRFIIEPGRRGTAHCIVMAMDYVARRHDKDEPLAFIHADHHVRDVEGFKRSFDVAARVSEQTKQIALIGIEPTFPSTGFGYIKRDGVIDENSGVYEVESFKEKPDFDTAKSYISTGRYLWNCGYFVGSVGVFLDEMQRNAPQLAETFNKLASIDINSDDYKQGYMELDNQVIDIALIEKADKLAVVAATFDWMDIGSFKDLHEANESDNKGNHFKGEQIYDDDLENVYVHNDQEKPVVVIGLDNVVVVNTKNGILVARKDLSQRVKDAVGKMQEREKKNE